MPPSASRKPLAFIVKRQKQQMKLDNYIDFNDKALSVLGTKKVIVPRDIDEIFSQFENFYKRENQNKMIFRGLNEAAYKMYTSSQRDWIKNKSNTKYSDYLNALIAKAKSWNNGILKTYLKSLNKDLEENNLAYFSIMQHFGLPSPLLDFSYNPFVALYFACKDVEKCYFDNDVENIRNFFSVYFIFPRWLKTKDFTKTMTNLNLKEIQNEAYQLENDYLVNNNLNIIAQEGLFLVNTNSKDDLISVMKKLDIEKKQKFFGCYNFHKSLAYTIMDKLRNKGIIDELLYPDLNKLKQIMIEHNF